MTCQGVGSPLSLRLGLFRGTVTSNQDLLYLPHSILVWPRQRPPLGSGSTQCCLPPFLASVGALFAACAVLQDARVAPQPHQAAKLRLYPFIRAPVVESSVDCFLLAPILSLDLRFATPVTEDPNDLASTRCPASSMLFETLHRLWIDSV